MMIYRLSVVRHFISVVVLGAIVITLVACEPMREPSVVPRRAAQETRRPIRVFWVNSYTSDDVWSLQIRTGILEAFARAGYAFVDGTLVWESHHLGLTRATSAVEVMLHASDVMDHIHEFDPDVVIVSDDEAVQSLVGVYEKLNVPFVYCGVTASIEGLGLAASGMTGVVERLHPLQTVAMAQEMTGRVGPYFVMGDSSVSGWARTLSVYEELQHAQEGSPLPFEVAHDWSAWQEAVLNHGAEADFVLIASYQPLPNDSGVLVSEREMMAWMWEHAPAPVFSLSDSMVLNGAVGGLVSHPYSQGAMAGQIALGRVGFVDAAPDYRTAVMHNRLVVNAAAARHWDLEIPMLFPLAAEVYESIPHAQGGQFW